MKTLVDAAQVAAKATADYITVSLQQSAAAHGWEDNHSYNVAVNYANGSFTLDIPSESEQGIMNQEYGTEDTRPTAVIRKYFNDTSAAESQFVSVMEKQLGVKLS